MLKARFPESVIAQAVSAEPREGDSYDDLHR